MTQTPRGLAAAAAVVACLVLVSACTQATVSPSPGPVASASASAGGSPSIAPSAAPSVAPSASAAPTTTPTQSAVAACAVESQEGPLASDRMTDVVVSSTADGDRITFVFGNPSLPGPAGQPRGDLMVAEPPYTHSGSGHLIDMQGDHVLQLRFTHMSLSADTGDLTYNGPEEFLPDLPVLRHAVLFDAFEGQVGWYIGYDGPGCVTLGRDGNNVTVVVEHP